jgi:hypothetical protein
MFSTHFSVSVVGVLKVQAHRVRVVGSRRPAAGEPGVMSGIDGVAAIVEVGRGARRGWRRPSRIRRAKQSRSHRQTRVTRGSLQRAVASNVVASPTARNGSTHLRPRSDAVRKSSFVVTRVVENRIEGRGLAVQCEVGSSTAMMSQRACISIHVFFRDGELTVSCRRRRNR